MESDNICIKFPNEKLLEKMIEEEELIRTSNDYRDKCTQVKNIPNGWLDVTANVQKNIAKKFGFTDEISCNIACNMMRRAYLLYPDNENFKLIPTQVRCNKAKQCKYSIDDICPDIKLHDLQDNCHQLYKLFDDRPTLIIAGSQT